MVRVSVNLRRTVPTTGRAEVIISVNWIVLDYRGSVVCLMKSRGEGGVGEGSKARLSTVTRSIISQISQLA